MERTFDTSVYVSRWDPEHYRWTHERLIRDAQIRQINDHGFIPGDQFQLRVPSIDDETGDVLDVDGDRSYDRTEIVAGTIDLHGGLIGLVGFTSDDNLSDEGRDAIPLTWERVADLQARGLVMTNEKQEWSRKRNKRVPVLGVHLLTEAANFADVEHDLALERDA